MWLFGYIDDFCPSVQFWKPSTFAFCLLIQHSPNPLKLLFFSWQLTVEEATDPEESSDIESKDTSHQSAEEETCAGNELGTTSAAKVAKARDHGHNNSLVTKTYSFRRMLSFRGSSLRRRGNNGSSSFEDTTCSSPGLHPSQRYWKKKFPSRCIFIDSISASHYSSVNNRSTFRTLSYFTTFWE